VSWWTKTFQLLAIDGEMARFRFVTNTAPINWTILVVVSSFFAVTTNEIVVRVGG
jgi:hypothetical protein